MGLKTPPLKVPAQVQGQMGLSVLKGLVPIKFHQGLTTILQVPNEALLHVLNLQGMIPGNLNPFESNHLELNLQGLNHRTPTTAVVWNLQGHKVDKVILREHPLHHHVVLTREAAGLLIVLLNPLVVDPDPEVVHHPILVQVLAVVPVVPGLRLGTSDLYLSQKNIK